MKENKPLSKEDIFSKNISDIENDAPNAHLSVETRRLLEEGAKFEKSRLEFFAKKSKYAILVAATFAVISVAQTVAIVSILPLKTVEPMLVKVDNLTGMTEIVRPLKDTADPEEVETKFFINNYVISRESYDWYSIRHDYDVVREMSSSDVFASYDAGIRAKDGPLNVLGKNMHAQVQIEGTTFIGSDTAQVRFTMVVKDQNGEVSPNFPTRSWIATINYEYLRGNKTSEKHKDLNPRDISINAYRLDPVVKKGE